MAYTLEDLARGGGMAAPSPEDDPSFQPFQKDQYEIAALLATLPDSEVELTRMLYEQQQAEGMMGEGPEGRMVGRTYVAPQTTEYAAQLADAYRGSQRESAATERYDQGVSDRDSAVKELLAALRGRKSEEPKVAAPFDPYAGSI
mgnify:CR=1 FL=1|jgi:hypothetical protein